MALAGTDLKYYISGGAIGAGNTDPDLALGGTITTTLAGTDLFDNINSTEASGGETEYRLVFVKNTNSVDTAYSVKLWILSNTPSTATAVTVALCDEGANADAETVANENTAPVGPVFDAAEDEANALLIGDLGPGEYHGVWVARAVTAGATAFANDTFTLRTKADTAP
jgi:hypothetical protein